MKRILFFFVDGVGLGPASSSNPFAAFDGPAFHQLGGQQWHQPFQSLQSDMHLARPLNATLDMDGLPQSGTGQASLFTGVNCAHIVGRHFGPYPHSKTHTTLKRANLFRRLQALPLPDPPAFANAFPPQYFDATRRRSTVTTYCCQSADVKLRDIEALREERALAADLTGTSWRNELQLNVPERSLAKSAEILANLSRAHSLTLFEYFLTDKVGHKRVDIAPSVLLTRLDQFLGALLSELDPTQEALLLTSDHGNLEDVSHTQHTRNPVPLIVYGWAAPYFADATDLTDVTPALVQALKASLPSSG